MSLAILENDLEEETVYLSGKFVEVLRYMRGIESQSALARMAQVDPAALNKWENGRKLPGDAIIRRVAKELGVDTEDLLSITDSERETARAAKHIARAQQSILDAESLKDIMRKYAVDTKNIMKYILRQPIPCVREGHPLYSGQVCSELLHQVSVPVVGYIPAGELWPVQDSEEMDTVLVDEGRISDPSQVFALQVKGKSMTGYGVEDGYIVVVDKLAQWIVGDLVLVQADNEYTLKRLISSRGSRVLQGLGPDELDYFYSEDNGSVRIVGVCVYKMRSELTNV